MTNYAWGVADDAAQARAVTELKAAGYDARPIRRLPGPGVGVADAGEEDGDRIEAIVRGVDPSAHPWPPGAFVR